MSDVISREYLKEHIEACWINGRPRYAPELNELLSWIDDVPSAQPEITRCKECKFAHLTYDGDCKYCDKWTDEFGIPEELYLDGDFFCGYAERRTDENNNSI